MENEIEVYAIAIMADEAQEKVKKLKEIGKRTGYVGVNIKYPMAFVLYRTREDQAKAYKEFKRSFDKCGYVPKPAYIPEPKTGGTKDAKNV